MSIDERIEMTQELIHKTWELQVATNDPREKAAYLSSIFGFKDAIKQLKADKSVHVS